MRWPFSRLAETPEPTEKRTRTTTRTVPLDLFVDLQEKYHALAMQLSAPPAAAPGWTPTATPADALGPLTRAALKEMGTGLSGAHKRAMTDKVLQLAETIKDDAALADRVRKGETPRVIAIG
jgi:hypothetical protein